MKYSPEEIGKMIKKERKKRNLTQEKLGELLSPDSPISEKQIAAYERGKPTPPIERLFKLCEIFDCELGYLLGEKEYTNGTTLETSIEDFVGLDKESLNKLRLLSSDKTVIIPIQLKYEKKKYHKILNNIIHSKKFYELMESFYNLDYWYNKSFFNELKSKYKEEDFRKAEEMYKYFPYIEYTPNTPYIPPEIYEICQEMQNAEEKDYVHHTNPRLFRYELEETFRDIITELYPKDDRHPC